MGGHGLDDSCTGHASSNWNERIIECHVAGDARPPLGLDSSRTSAFERHEMARVALLQEEDRPELADLIAKIKGGRQGRLLNLYKALLHSPPLADAWLQIVGAVRWSTELDGALRE